MCVIPEEREVVTERGKPVEKVRSRGTFVRFVTGGITDDELSQALVRWKGPHGTVSDADPKLYFSVYDSDLAAAIGRWDEETKAKVEEVLLDREGLDYIRLVEAAPARPWPSYDEMEDAEKIAWTAETTGTLELALAYEKATLQRPGVIDALEGVKVSA